MSSASRSSKTVGGGSGGGRSLLFKAARNGKSQRVSNLVTYTVVTKLLPAMEPATGMQENAVVLGGFFTGVNLVLALQIFLPEYDYGRNLLGGAGTQH